MRVKGRLILSFAACISLLLVGTWVANAAPLFQMPFPCGETWRVHTYAGHNPPQAVDLNVGSGNDDLGRPVVASAAGTVDLREAGMSSYGHYIVIDHGSGSSTLYAHLQSFSVSDGAQVKMGDQIGKVGNNDGALYAHLHYEQRLNGTPVQIRWNGSLVDADPEISMTSLNCPAVTFSRDWNGDAKADLLTRDANGLMHLYAGNGSTGFMSPTGGQIGGPGWNAFSALLRPGDWSGDAKPDIITRDAAGYLHLYRGNGTGGFMAGTGELIGGGGWNPFTALVGTGDWNGDGKPDLIGRHSDGTLRLYRGNGTGGFMAGTGEQIGGGGWNSFSVILGPGDWNRDGKVDLIGRYSDGTLRLYRGNGTGGFMAGTGEQIGGGGWNPFTALVGPGDWNRDGNVDLVGRYSDGTMRLYRGNGTGGFMAGTGEQIGGGGWNSFNAIL